LNVIGELQPGEILEGSRGTYRIERKLSVGGMGVVWLAQAIEEEKPVIIKFPRITGDPQRDRINMDKLVQEARILLLLDHPRIPALVDVISIDALDIPVIEYIDGETMERIYMNSPTPVEEATDIILKVLETVSYIHSLNIIHRDIRPKNIMIDRKNEIHLIDFGTAKYFYEQIQDVVSAPGGYTAPEQLKWSSTPQSDIWSVGATYLFLLTGKHPLTFFKGYPENPLPINPDEIVPGLPEHISYAIRKALMPHPEDRFASAEEMIATLRGLAVPVKRTLPILVVAGIEVPIVKRRVIIGRAPRSQSGPVRVEEEDGSMKLLIRDPKAFISRSHAEIYESEGKWYIRDLGSLNKTAVSMGLGGWQIVWNGRGRISDPAPLKDGAIIALAYKEDLGPYFTITFRAPQK